MKRIVAVVLVAIGVAQGLSSSALAEDRREREVTVMTRNVFLGADLTPALAALRNPRQLPTVVSQIYANVVATDFRTRAEALADEIAASEPDLVGLQEAVIWRTQRPSSPLPAEDVAYDFLAILESELAERGLSYRRAKVKEGSDIELPASDGMDVRLTDREVILSRRDSTRPKLSFRTRAGVPTKPSCCSRLHPGSRRGRWRSSAAGPPST